MIADERNRAALEAIRTFHEEVDRAVAEVTARLPLRLACARGCADCCVDELTVFPVEADRIRAEAPELLKSGLPAPAGKCAFLDENDACRVYRSRPYVCRTQGLPLRWFEAGDAERRDLCPLSDEPLAASGRSLKDLESAQCWTLGPFESRLAGMQAELHGFADPPPRITLRSLFGREGE